MRKPIIAGNWKMNKLAGEATAFITSLKTELTGEEQAEVVIAPPALFIASMLQQTAGTAIKIAAQNVHYEESGAYTGEISPVQLADLGCDYVIIGHSERRQLFNETDEGVAKKAAAVFKHQMIPIVCCGETLEQREQGVAKEWISGQIRAGLAELSEKQVGEAVIAYEPIWAIGTGVTASSADAAEMAAHIREVVFEAAGSAAADKIRILYGGSVKPDNIAELMADENIDGALVGGASLEVASYTGLLDGGK